MEGQRREGVLRSLPNPLTPADLARLRDARRPAPAPANNPLRVDRRISSRGSLSVAGQRIQVGIGHAGRTVTVEQADTSFRVYDAGQLLIEVTRTTTKTIARFKARKAEPSRTRQSNAADVSREAAGNLTAAAADA